MVPRLDGVTVWGGEGGDSKVQQGKAMVKE